MFYTIYKITNMVNSKIYIGCHKTKNLDDKYMGSGKLLKRAFKKYGLDNFKKEILEVFDSAKAMFECEFRLVNKDFVNCKDTYNLGRGGSGGNRLGKNHHTHSNQHMKMMNVNCCKSRKENPNIFIENNRRCGERLKLLHKQGKINYNTFNGRTHTDITKRKMSESQKGKQVGSGNSQFGTMWITNEQENKKILKNDSIPKGFRKGRKIKF